MAKNKVMGDAECDRCGHTVQVCAMTNGNLYYTCPPPADGGCGRQDFSRYERSSKLLAERIIKWRDKADREKWLGKSPVEPAPKPKPKSPRGTKPEPAPSPEPEPEAAASDLETDLWG